ncbi:MAG: hypothetical protein HY308_00580 [Gammaproteobacteria bacterium]|nr:hypothetical protein [Gammaproteobacteria bacterium]
MRRNINPFTPEGLKEIEEILDKHDKDLDAAVERSKINVNEEPGGALTVPSEIDLRRDRKKMKEGKDD